MKILVYFFWFELWASAALGQAPPFPSLPPTAAKVYREVKTVKGAQLLISRKTSVAPVPGVTLTWNAPTNAFYIFEACTNLAAPVWIFRTNALITATSVFVASSGADAEFYRAYTALPVVTNGWYVETLDILTNQP